jgi:hypothetical protein
MGKKNEVAEAQSTEVALPGGIDWAADSGKGLENTSADDYQIPFINILEQLSPQVNKKKPEYIEGAEAGMIANSLTGQLWTEEDPLLVIPCAYVSIDLEWKPNRGGLAGVHKASANMLSKTRKSEDGKRDVLENGNEIINTAQHYVLYKAEGGDWKPAVVSMDRTRRKCSKIWNSLMADLSVTRGDQVYRNLPTFSHIWKLSAVEKSNDQNDWHIWSASKHAMIEDAALYTQAKKFSESVTAGEVEAKIKKRHLLTWQEKGTRNRFKLGPLVSGGVPVSPSHFI